MILSREGARLAEMLLPFRLGGRPLGSGKQWMSWITRDDVVGVMRHLLETTSLSGPVNATAPQPVTNAEFTRILGRLLRPTLFRCRPSPCAWRSANWQTRRSSAASACSPRGCWQLATPSSTPPGRRPPPRPAPAARESAGG